MPDQTSLHTFKSSGLERAINLVQTGTGNATGLSLPPAFNYTLISEDIDYGAGFVTGHGIVHVFGGSAAKGGREAFYAQAQLNAATSSSNTNRNYVGVTGIFEGNANDGGSNAASPSTSKGAGFGAGFVGVLNNGATHYLNLTGAEFNTAAKTGSSVSVKSLAQYCGRHDDAVAGSFINAMHLNFNQPGAVKWGDGILFQSDAFGHEWPLATTATIIRTAGGSVAKGIDFSTTTFTGNAFASPGFSVDNDGDVTARTVKADVLEAVGTGDVNLRVKTTGGVGGEWLWQALASNGCMRFYDFSGSGGETLTLFKNGGFSGGGVALDTGYYFQLPNNSAKKAKAYSWDQYSDGRLKSKRSKVTDGLKIALALAPQRYLQSPSIVEDGKLKILDGGDRTIGFIAQEVEKVLPEAVTPGVTETELWSVDPAKFMPVAIAAIQELHGIVQDLKKEVAELRR